ncbi:gliding motility protein GldM [Mucilaginibacter sp. X4EP1]|uniref:type IX secretion system motor protein PorM/GldM n=1 Tax=Mucilaginibacter sp. X4EP1 TaxID=2723092 RepID=UPI00216927BE|nr:gliding motility protein GldM [Mucilaginibacter sp. X4EP1]MCS3813720.1 gliding motility-associated protein GldM [Mucilaginibacter sp. X4EP1]
MAGGKQSPRQRMMGILYLVLLGLVALSVPDSLMDAFKNIRISLDNSTANVDKGLQTSIANFEATKLKEQKERAQPIYNSAKNASQIANDLNDYVKKLKDELVEKGGGINPTTGDVDKRENLDASAEVMINDKKGEQLREKIESTKSQLLDLLKPNEKAGINFSLSADAPHITTGPQKTWEEAYFGDGIPLGAALTTLAKIQTDTKNAENEVVKKILGRIDVAQVTLDQFVGVAVAPTSYVLQGQPYTADIFLTAYDSKSNPNIVINGSSIAVSEGKGKYTVNTSKEGVFTYSGTITVKGPEGNKEYKLPTQTYQVAKPSAVVSPDKMNVLYIGVPNPVSVSAPGVAKSDIRVSMSGGSIEGKDGKYTVNVKTLGEATINVSGEISKGKVTNLGSSLFRVKRIPDPKPQFAGKSGGNTSAANIRAQDRLFAKLDNFDFDAKFNVTRFTMLVAKPRQDVIILSATGNELTGSMKALINTVSPGTTVVFKDIIAVGPDGTQRGLDPIVLSAN